eukprot:s1348_g13.t1
MVESTSCSSPAVPWQPNPGRAMALAALGPLIVAATALLLELLPERSLEVRIDLRAAALVLAVAAACWTSLHLLKDERRPEEPSKASVAGLQDTLAECRAVKAMQEEILLELAELKTQHARREELRANEQRVEDKRRSVDALHQEMLATSGVLVHRFPALWKQRSRTLRRFSNGVGRRCEAQVQDRQVHFRGQFGALLLENFRQSASFGTVASQSYAQDGFEWRDFSRGRSVLYTFESWLGAFFFWGGGTLFGTVLLRAGTCLPRLNFSGGALRCGSEYQSACFISAIVCCLGAMAEKVKIGILSTASIVGKVLPGLKHGMEVVGVASRDRQKAQDFCTTHDCGVGMLYDEMLERDDVDVLYIPLPTGLRNEKIAKAISRGKHIYSEKPMGGTASELSELLKLCEEKGLQWMDGTMWTKEIEKKLSGGELGQVLRVSASFTFMAPDEAWLQGGNGRTDKSREPMGCLGDQGWYPLSAILWAFGWTMPERVMCTHVTLNKVDTIVQCAGTLWFPGNRSAVFDCGCTSPHRIQYEIVCEKGTLKVDDLVGGQQRTGNFAAYEVPFVGSAEYIQGDVMGKDQVVQVEACDHVNMLVDDLASCIKTIKAGGKPDLDWPRRSLAVHKVMSAVFESAQNGGIAVEVAN